MRRCIALLIVLAFTASVTWGDTTVPNQGSWTDRSGSLTTGGTAQTIAALRAGRSYFLFQNISPDDLWINCGVTAVQDQPSFKIIAGGSFVMEGNSVCTDLISVIGATTGQKFSAKEM